MTSPDPAIEQRDPTELLQIGTPVVRDDSAVLRGVRNALQVVSAELQDGWNVLQGDLPVLPIAWNVR